MAQLQRYVFIVRTLFYVILTVSSMFILVPMGLQMYTHEGNCLLYASSRNKAIEYGPRSNCYYCIATSVIFCLLYGGIMSIIGILALIGQISCNSRTCNVMFSINVLLDILATILLLVSGGMISVGFKLFCDNLNEAAPDSQCQLDFINLPDTGEEDYFYMRLAIPEAAAWICFFLVLIQSIFGSVVLYKNNMLPFLQQYSEIESSKPEDSEKPKKDSE